MTQLYEISVKLSPNQKKNLSKAYHSRETIVLRLTNSALSGSNKLFVLANVVKRLNKSRQLKKGMDIKLYKRNPWFISSSRCSFRGASQIVKKMSGEGVKTGGFFVPQNQMHKLIPCEDLLNMKQKKEPPLCSTKTQRGGFLGTLLTSFGIPLAIEAIKKLTGKGSPRIGLQKINKTNGKGAPRIGLPPISFKTPPPFYTYSSIGQGVKKQKKAKGCY